MASSWDETLRVQGAIEVFGYMLGGKAESYARAAAGEQPQVVPFEEYMEIGPDLGVED